MRCLSLGLQLSPSLEIKPPSKFIVLIEHLEETAKGISGPAPAQNSSNVQDDSNFHLGVLTMEEELSLRQKIGTLTNYVKVREDLPQAAERATPNQEIFVRTRKSSRTRWRAISSSSRKCSECWRLRVFWLSLSLTLSHSLPWKQEFSGISDLNQVVSQFLDREEEIFKIFSYIQHVNREVDALDE